MASRTDANDGIVDRTRATLALAGRITVLPTDLVVVALTVVATVAAVAMLPRGSVLRMLVAAPLAVFWPGYALVSLVAPGSTSGPPGPELGTPSRVALAFGSSLALLPLTLVALGAVAPLSPTNVLVTLAGFTVLAAGLATVRRRRLPARRRYQPDLEGALDWATSPLAGRRTTAGKLGVVVLVVGIALAASTAALAVAAPPSEERFTNFYLATEDDGNLTAAGYPSTFTAGEPESLVAVVTNEERATTEYEVVVQLQRVESGTVVERTELTRFANATAAGDTWRYPHSVTPTTTGEELRLTYLLYRGEAPTSPTTNDAYRHLHLWIDVESA